MDSGESAHLAAVISNLLYPPQPPLGPRGGLLNVCPRTRSQNTLSGTVAFNSDKDQRRVGNMLMHVQMRRSTGLLCSSVKAPQISVWRLRCCHVGAHGRKPHRHRKNMQTPQRNDTWLQDSNPGALPQLFHLAPVQYTVRLSHRKHKVSF